LDFGSAFEAAEGGEGLVGVVGEGLDSCEAEENGLGGGEDAGYLSYVLKGGVYDEAWC
jgi:hypothetical protein